MFFPKLILAATVAGRVVDGHRFAMYYDQWHLNSPTKDQTANISHVISAFLDPITITTDPPTPYWPFQTPDNLRTLFDEGTKMCLAVGGWGWITGFEVAHGSEQSRTLFAKNLAALLNEYGYDCVDIDWEYPGGNGIDYIQYPNTKKTDEIQNFPLLLEAIKEAIGDKELSIAVPGLQRDMIGYTSDTIPKIMAHVDTVNVMAYDLMNRRDTTTKHHTSVNGALETVETYLSLGMDAEKMNLGFAMYAKYFETVGPCNQPIGCTTAVLEDEYGNDTLRSGAITFFDGVSVLANGQADNTQGGEWYFEADGSKFWTWDTPEFIAQKFDKIVKAKKLGGVFAWSLGEDHADFSYTKAIQLGLSSL
ncbi:glycoside hydrolase family 18 protein [Xylariaceae sp. FL1272]|nr:glycoside hydrolase family 18 protein [Xylariaceae sp. FL1272]